MLKIDGHVHFVGDGSNGSGCWLRRNLGDRLFEPIVKSQAGIYRSSQKLGIDQAYEEKLIDLIDIPHLMLFSYWPWIIHTTRREIAEKTRQNSMSPMIMFFIWLKNILRSFLPAPFIQPVRMQSRNLNDVWIKELKVLKLLPNCHDVDCSDNQYRPFWEKLSKIGPSFPRPYGRRIFRSRSQ